jgi:hypothetical protein
LTQIQAVDGQRAAPVGILLTQPLRLTPAHFMISSICVLSLTANRDHHPV